MVDVPFALAPALPELPADAALGRVQRTFYLDANAALSSANPKDLLCRNLDAIEEQMINVILTPLGSDVFEPTYGSDVPFMLFDPVSNTTARAMRTTIRSALTRWMNSRIAELQVAVVENHTSDSYTATFTYTCPGLTTRRQGFRAVLQKR